MCSLMSDSNQIFRLYLSNNYKVDTNISVYTRKGRATPGIHPLSSTAVIHCWLSGNNVLLLLLLLSAVFELLNLY